MFHHATCCVSLYHISEAVRTRRSVCVQSFLAGSEEGAGGGGGILDLSFEEFDQRDQDYRADLDQNQRPSNIIMLRMLPPNATANEVCLQATVSCS